MIQLAQDGACPRCDGTGMGVDHEETGRRAREAREAAGVSLRELSQAIGYSATHVSDLETGCKRWRQELVDLYNEVLAEHTAKY